MTINQDVKKRVLQALLKSRENWRGTDEKFATSLGINKSVLSQLKGGKTDKVLADAKWISIARKLGVLLGDEQAWIIAKTATFQYITTQLAFCQSMSISSLLCDEADIGKTTAAKWYVANNANAIYVDCSQVKNKQRLIRYIAKEFGTDHTSRYADVYEDLVYYLKTLDNPLIILDEAGDLDYAAFLELKALWNATEGHCGSYMMGADGLEAKFDRGRNCRKVGYAEIFRRYGSGYKKAMPHSTDEKMAFRNSEIVAIIKANLPAADINTVLKKCNGSLTRAKIEVHKITRNAHK